MAPFALAPGVWQILPTPFRGRDLAVDHGSLRRVIAHAAAVGVTGLVALGVLGEAARLDGSERAAVLDTVLDAAGLLPVVCGIGALATAPVVEEARALAAGGARTVMVLVPSPDPRAIAAHLTAIAEAAGVGIVVQDHPATTGIRVAPADLVAAIAQAGVGVAVKAEAPPTPAAVAAVAASPGLPVFGGLGGVGLLDELAAGAAGAMTGFAFPEALVAAVNAFTQEGFMQARTALAPYLPLMISEAQVPISLAVRKEILRRRGLIDEAAVRMPGAGLPEWAGSVLDAHLAALEGDPTLGLVIAGVGA